MIELPIIVDLTVNRNEVVFDFDLENTNPEIEFTSSNVINLEYPTYDGEYTVNAGYEPVVLPTTNKTLTQDVTVNRLQENDLYIHDVEISDTGLLRSTAAVSPGYNDATLFSSFRQQLQTVEGQTVTPTFYEQTIAVRREFVTGTIKVAAVPRYDGVLEFTPSEQSQTIEISGKMAAADIVVNPIPSNYGRIEWNGSFLAVI